MNVLPYTKVGREMYALMEVGYHSKSLLLAAASAHSSAQLLLAPLPPLVAQLLPSTGTSLHGEHAADLPSVYERIANIPNSLEMK